MQAKNNTTKNHNKILPFSLTKNVEEIIENLKSKNIDYSGISNQVFPSELENNFSVFETEDPLGAKNYQISPNFIHQYKNRGLVLTSSNCFSYCRYCFRKDFVSCNNYVIDENEINFICQYLEKNPQIKELLFSGGDPLTLSDQTLDLYISKIKSIRPRMIIRICSRAIFFAPHRITDSLISILRKYSGIWFIPHINHPYEIHNEFAKKSVEAFTKLKNAGIPIQSQTVLLKNVNDKLELLVDLFNSLVELGIKPGYLFQCDLPKGTSHFRVPLEEACALYQKLKEELSGLSLPKFSVDLPGGGGKFNLDSLNPISCIISQDEDYYYFNKDEKVYKYPKI